MSAGIPIPVSVTDTVTSSAVADAVIVISPPSGVYFVALVSRLTNTCDRRSTSASSAIDSRGRITRTFWDSVPRAREVDSTAAPITSASVDLVIRNCS